VKILLILAFTLLLRMCLRKIALLPRLARPCVGLVKVPPRSIRPRARCQRRKTPEGVNNSRNKHRGQGCQQPEHGTVATTKNMRMG